MCNVKSRALLTSSATKLRMVAAKVIALQKIARSINSMLGKKPVSIQSLVEIGNPHFYATA